MPLWHKLGNLFSHGIETKIQQSLPQGKVHHVVHQIQNTLKKSSYGTRCNWQSNTGNDRCSVGCHYKLHCILTKQYKLIYTNMIQYIQSVKVQSNHYNHSQYKILTLIHIFSKKLCKRSFHTTYLTLKVILKAIIQTSY